MRVTVNSSKPKLLIAIGELIEGAGQSRVVIEETNHLHADFEITIVADSIVLSSDIPAKLVNLSSSKNIVKSVKHLRKLMKDSDVIHCHDSLKMMMMAAMGSKPWVATANGIAPFWLRKNLVDMTKCLVTNLCYPLLYRRATRVVAISPYIERWLRRLSIRKCILITCGARVSGHLVERRAPTVPTILYVGEISRRKGMRDLVRAIELLHKEVNFEVVGVGRFDRYLSPHLQSVPTVNFRGLVSDEELELLYERATCVFSASHWEGYGLPIIEGFAKGTPALVRNSTNLTNLVRESKAGKLFKRVSEIPIRFEEIISEWEQLSANAQQFAIAHSWETTFAEYQQLFLSLI